MFFVFDLVFIFSLFYIVFLYLKSKNVENIEIEINILFGDDNEQL